MAEFTSSVLVFRDGPRGGEREPVMEGWPAPDRYEHRDFSGYYERYEVLEDRTSGEVLHLYSYHDPDQPAEP